MPSKREELQSQLEALQGQLADLDENDYECEVEVDGKRTRVQGKTAKSWLQKIGLLDADAAPDSDGDGGDGGDGDGTSDPKPKQKGYFG